MLRGCGTSWMWSPGPPCWTMGTSCTGADCRGRDRDEVKAIRRREASDSSTGASDDALGRMSRTRCWSAEAERRSWPWDGRRVWWWCCCCCCCCCCWGTDRDLLGTVLGGATPPSLSGAGPGLVLGAGFMSYSPSSSWVVMWARR